MTSSLVSSSVNGTTISSNRPSKYSLLSAISSQLIVPSFKPSTFGAGAVPIQPFGIPS